MKLDMDERFRAAQAAIHDGNLVLFESLLAGDPGLATARSRCSHPTLLQCLVLTISEQEHLEGAIRALAEGGAELTDPLIAACGVDNVCAAAALLDLGANIEGNGKWSPLEEALYWGSRKALELLLSRGAVIDSLRKAAGVGRTDYLDGCFTESGELTKAAGFVRWPWFDKPIPTRSGSTVSRLSTTHSSTRRRGAGSTPRTCCSRVAPTSTRGRLASTSPAHRSTTPP